MYLISSLSKWPSCFLLLACCWRRTQGLVLACHLECLTNAKLRWDAPCPLIQTREGRLSLCFGHCVFSHTLTKWMSLPSLSSANQSISQSISLGKLKMLAKSYPALSYEAWSWGREQGIDCKFSRCSARAFLSMRQVIWSSCCMWQCAKSGRLVGYLFSAQPLHLNCCPILFSPIFLEGGQLIFSSAAEAHDSKPRQGLVAAEVLSEDKTPPRRTIRRRLLPLLSVLLPSMSCKLSSEALGTEVPLKSCLRQLEVAWSLWL